MGNRASKSESLYQQLREAYGQAAPGARLPTVRAIMKEYGVSQGSVDRALERLIGQGIVEARPREGLFAAAPATGNKIRVDLFLSNHPSHTVDWFRQSLLAGFAESEFTVVIHYYRYDRPLSQIGRDPDREIAMVWPNQATLSSEDIAFLGGMARHVIMLNLPTHSLSLDSLCGDDDLGGCMAAKHLIDLGHRRLAMLVTSLTDHPTILARTAGFLKMARLMDVPAEVIQAGTRWGDNGTAKAHAALRARLRAGRPDFTGLFVDTDWNINGVYKALQENGLSVPRDISVISHDGIPDGEFFSPPITTIHQDQKQWAQEAVRLLRRRLAAPATGRPPTAIHAYVPPDLLVRASTAAPPG